MSKQLSKRLNLFLLLTIVLGLTSCGDMFTKKESNKSRYNQFATCTFDVKSLSKILTSQIKSDLLCLESNLNLFIDVVETDKIDFLPYDSLATYLVKNVDDVDEATLSIVKAVFELNGLIFGDSNNYIARKNVKKLTEILIEFNKLFVEGNVYTYYTSNEKISYSEHNQRKSSVYRSFIKIGELFSAAMIENNNKIDISKFIDKFRSTANKKVISYVESLLFIKKAVLGGDEKYLTHTELKRMTKYLGDIGKVTFDFINLPDTLTEKDEEEEVLKILKEDVQTAYQKFYYKNADDEVIVTYEQLVHLMDAFFPQYNKYVKYKTTFLKIKKILLGSDSENFVASDISFLLNDILYKNISKGVFIYRTYSENESILGTVRRIFYNLYNVVTFNTEEEGYIVDLNRVIKDYRFYQGSKLSPVYDYNFSRNVRGLFDIVMYEDLAKRFFSYYGKIDFSAKGDYVMSMENLESFMQDFSELLEGEKYLLPGRGKNTAETISLMTSLFHSQSNGDARIEIPEFVEFAITLTTSLNLADEMYQYSLENCTVDEKNRVTPTCFRNNFMNFMDTEMSNNISSKVYLPGLYKYMQQLGPQTQIDEYLIATSKFSRVCTQFSDGSEVPMRRSDFFVSWAGLLAVEQSMLRFDINQSGVLEPREVNKAFYIYKRAIEAMIPFDFLKKYSKEFFQYLVKYKRVPEVPEITGLRTLWRGIREGVHFVKFLFKSDRNKEANADRMTFAAVLKIIAENSPANKANPYPCETLR